MTDKQYIKAQQLLDDSHQLGLKILESGYQPHIIIGIWRGGTPVAIAIHELFDYLGIHSDHAVVRTSLYSGIEERMSRVRVHGLRSAVENIKADDRLLIIDDVYDTGLSVRQLIEDIEAECRDRSPQIKVATPYFKPSKNQTDRTPDFYLHETDKWLVFPHELVGLSIEEIAANKAGGKELGQALQAFGSAQS